MNSETTLVITGANKGIGFELAKQAAEKGVRIFAGVRTLSKAGALQDALGSKGEVLELDVTSDKSVHAFTDQLRVRTKSIDILINNAGIALDASDTLESITGETLRQTFETNSIGPVRVTQALLPFLRSTAGSKVAVISSLMGSLSDNKGGGAYAYRMSKAAVNMFVRSFAADERDIITITLHPGWVKTEMGGAAAPLEPAKSAEGLLTVIDSCTAGDSGKFFNHAGRELPW